MDTWGGSISSPGMALAGPIPLPLLGPAPRIPRRRSIEGTGELTPINEPVSARVAGVGIVVVASPNKASMSSNLTPAVSG
jgi:hypothetical protein